MLLKVIPLPNPTLHPAVAPSLRCSVPPSSTLSLPPFLRVSESPTTLPASPSSVIPASPSSRSWFLFIKHTPDFTSRLVSSDSLHLIMITSWRCTWSCSPFAPRCLSYDHGAGAQPPHVHDHIWEKSRVLGAQWGGPAGHREHCSARQPSGGARCTNSIFFSSEECRKRRHR